MAFDINEIKSQLQFDGARQNLFMVQFLNPANSIADIKAPFLITASELPESHLGTIQVPYFGRMIKLAGDRSYQPWPITVINDEDFLIKNAMEDWSAKINSPEGNTRRLAKYKSQARITQLSKSGKALRTYIFHGIWPETVSEIGMSWSDNDNIETFRVTFQYDYWTVEPGVTGNAGGTR